MDDLFPNPFLLAGGALSSLICLALGGLHLAGMRQVWPVL